MKNEALNVLFSQIIDDTVGTEAEMTVCFIKNVLSLQVLLSAVWKIKFERHLQVDRKMVKDCLACDHIYYARYLPYQQDYLRQLQRINSNAMMNLTQRDFGGSLSGDSFSFLYGDLITKIFNWQTERQAGPHCAGFSADIAKVNTWVGTSHVHAKVRQRLADWIQLNKSKIHKECTPGTGRLYKNNVELFKEKLNQSKFKALRHLSKNKNIERKQLRIITSWY